MVDESADFARRKLLCCSCNSLSTYRFLRPDIKDPPPPPPLPPNFIIVFVSGPLEQLVRAKRLQFSFQLNIKAQQASCLLSRAVLWAIFFRTSVDYNFKQQMSVKSWFVLEISHLTVTGSFFFFFFGGGGGRGGVGGPSQYKKSRSASCYWPSLYRHLHCFYYNFWGFCLRRLSSHVMMTWRWRCFLSAVCLRRNWRDGWKWCRHYFLSTGRTDFLQTKFSSNSTLKRLYLWLWIFSVSFLSTSRTVCFALKRCSWAHMGFSVRCDTGIGNRDSWQRKGEQDSTFSVCQTMVEDRRLGLSTVYIYT